MFFFLRHNCLCYYLTKENILFICTNHSEYYNIYPCMEENHSLLNDLDATLPEQNELD